MTNELRAIQEHICKVFARCGAIPEDADIKFALFEPGEPPRFLRSGQIERIGQAKAILTFKDDPPKNVDAPDHPAAVNVSLGSLEESAGVESLVAVGHRVVHGGQKYSAPQRLTAEVVEELRRLSPFDPEHLPEEILLTEAFQRRFPDLPQVACFDTAFHEVPRVARLLPIPRYEALGVRRYGGMRRGRRLHCTLLPLDEARQKKRGRRIRAAAYRNSLVTLSTHKRHSPSRCFSGEFLS